MAVLDRFPDDEAGELRRRVEDAEALSLRRLLHGRLDGARGRCGLEPEDAFHADPLQLGHRALEEVAEHLQVHFVAEVVGADVVEEVGPVVLQLEVVDFGLAAEQAAVIAPFDAQAVEIPLVHALRTGPGSSATADWSLC